MEQVRKILIILSTAEREKAMAGLMLAKNTQENHWFDEVRVVLFGPVERLLSEIPGRLGHRLHAREFRVAGPRT